MRAINNADIDLRFSMHSYVSELFFLNGNGKLSEL